LKKWVQNFCSFLLSAGLLCGCSVNANVPESTPVQHIVTQVDITSHHAGTVTKHSYRDPKNRHREGVIPKTLKTRINTGFLKLEKAS